MINFNNVKRKIKKIARETQQEYGDQLIIEIPSGYQVFGKYNMTHTGDVWRIVSYEQFIDLVFNSPKNAMLWCIAENAGDRTLAANIHKSDQKLFNKQFDIQNKLHLLHSDTIHDDVRDILLVKLDEDIRDSNQIKRELRKQEHSAKYIQTKGSHYELTGNISNR